MITFDASLVRDALHNAGLSPHSYSGRGMYGDRCISVTSDDGGASLGVKVGLAIAAEIARVEAKDGGDVEYEIENALEELPAASTDSMGYGSVLYWPRLTWDPAWADEDDDDSEED